MAAAPAVAALPALAALAALALGGCKEEPPPSYLRLEGPAPKLAAAPASRASLIVFWATWCAPCRKETPSLRALAGRPPKDLGVVVLSHDEDLDEVRKYFGGEPDPALNLRLDEGQAAADAFGIKLLPSAVLVVDGQQVAKFSGAQDWDGRPMRALLEKLTRPPN